MTATAVTPSARIGLNETAIGIIVPKYWGQLLSNTIGSIGVAEKMIFFGKMLKSEEAKIVGLIDEVTSDKHRIIEVSDIYILVVLYIIIILRSL
jgi:enoyl-CoA hydratase/carnithine racemase